MITLLNATNRPNNRTSVVSETYQQLLISKSIPHLYLNLEEIDGNLILEQSKGNKVNELEMTLEKYIYSVNKIIIISPEYNGSFPGILKLFIDTMEPKKIEGKKVALVGVATGRAGNVRGMDHLTNIFNYLNIEVLPYKLPVSTINKFIAERKITDNGIMEAINKQIDLFVKY